jgi:hypothetical protein
MKKWYEDGELRFAVGIEDTFIADERPGMRRLDEYELLQHNHYWHADLGLAAESGASMIRWGIPWYRVNPEPGKWDFSFVDRVVDRLQELGIEPIVDLMHYGTPLWLQNAFANTSYPDRVAEYAAKVADRYRGRLRNFTPLNEPLLNVIYCGEFGVWPPYLTGDDGFVTLLEKVGRGIVLTQHAVADVLGDEASFVHVEASYRFGGAIDAVRDHVEFLRRRAYVVEDLVTGGIGDDHPLLPWLQRNGFPDDALQWHTENRAIPDVMGVNHYPAVSTEGFTPDDNPTGTLDDPRPRINDWTDGLEEVLRGYAERYGRPVMLSETSIGGPPEQRIRWLEDSVAAVRRLRDGGVPIVGYTWWAVFGWINWSYREGTRPVEDYVNTNGLWDLEMDAAGVFQRVRTPVVDAYCAQALSGNGADDEHHLTRVAAGGQ